MFLYDCYSAKTTRRREQVLADGHIVAQMTSIVVWALGIFIIIFHSRYLLLSFILVF